jgi:hypothetical protein
MNPYRITYTRDDMPKGYIGSAVKHARDEKEALKHFCGTKPDKDGIFRMKRGGIGKLKSITIYKE